MNDTYIGKKISGLGLRSKQILSRKSDYHKKSAVIFNSHRLNVTFKSYGLPIPSDFSLDHSDQSDKPNKINDLERSKEDSVDNQNQKSLDRLKSNNHSNNGDWSKWSKEKSAKQVQNNSLPELIYETEEPANAKMMVDEII